MNLRACLDFLDKRYQNRVDPRRVRAAYIMVLLRIADYFQLQSERAPTGRTDVVSFKSPFSNLEWRVHQSVTEINNSGNDPEAIVVNAAPTSVSAFLRLRSWMSDLQDELDKSWAVLGETYGLQKHNSLNDLTLRVRRIRSNLDNLDSFSSTVEYIPANISFRTDNADLLKLLIGPLYNSDIRVGVRELMQNAIDAVRELKDLMSTLRIDIQGEQFDIEGDVQVSVELGEDNKPQTIEITDRGIGMTLEVITEYYLKAGASFRRSNEWKVLHENDQGKSKILRSGRFGVGALAAFLLGEEIEVTTRHCQTQPNEGYHFRATVDSAEIEVRRVSCPVGTKIRILLSDSAKTALQNPFFRGKRISGNSSILGHYFVNDPKVVRIYGNEKVEVDAEYMVPAETDTFGNGWRKFKTEEFTVFWRIDERESRNIYCNGIFVTDEPPDERLAIGDQLSIALPSISIYDRDGNLPLNLQRNQLNVGRCQFVERLWREMITNLVAEALLDAPQTSDDAWFSFLRSNMRFMHYYGGETGSAWLVTKDGFLLRHQSLVSALEAKRVIVAAGGNRGYGRWTEVLRQRLDTHTFLAQTHTGGITTGGNRAKGVFGEWLQGYQRIAGHQLKNVKVFLPKRTRRRIESLAPGRQLRLELDKFRHYDEKSGVWTNRPENLESEAIRLMGQAAESADLWNGTIVVEADIDKPTQPVLGNAIVADQWMRILEQPWIPFDLTARQEFLNKIHEMFPEIAASVQQEVEGRVHSVKRTDQEDAE